MPGLRTGFPDAEHGGTMGFEELLERVEQTIARKVGRPRGGRRLGGGEAGRTVRIQP
ncbi:MAG: hypothetical protein ACLTSX_07895 [Collinsella sp.]